MNTKMKVLSLALVGLCGYAGSAMATCPAGPDQANGGAWSALNVGGGTSSATVVTGGYDGTECKLQSQVANNGAARASVRDDSPANETRYRAQFIFDPSALSGANGANQATIFLANAQAAHNTVLNLVKITFAGSGGGSTSSGKKLFIAAACETGGICSTQVPLPNQTGPNRIEVDLTVGASGALRYWVNDAATTGITEASGVTLALTGGNAGWVGVKQAYLGVASPSVSYRGTNAGVNAWFDQFDSRRQTFIGH